MCYYKYLRCWVRTANVAVPRIDGGGVVVHGNVQTKWRQSKQVLTQIVDVWGKYEVVPCYNRPRGNTLAAPDRFPRADWQLKFLVTGLNPLNPLTVWCMSSCGKSSWYKRPAFFCFVFSFCSQTLNTSSAEWLQKNHEGSLRLSNLKILCRGFVWREGTSTSASAMEMRVICTIATVCHCRMV